MLCKRAFPCKHYNHDHHTISYLLGDGQKGYCGIFRCGSKIQCRNIGDEANGLIMSESCLNGKCIYDPFEVQHCAFCYYRRRLVKDRNIKIGKKQPLVLF